MNALVPALMLLFVQLSVLAFGGGVSILPEMQRQVVDVQHWMTAQDFGALFALGQAAPGPNMMIVPLIGWHVAGLSGLLGSSLAMFGPSSAITIVMLQIWDRCKDRPWRRYVQAGLVPITAGLVAASASLIAKASIYNVMLAFIVAVSALLSLKTRLHPLWILAGGAALGLLGIGF